MSNNKSKEIFSANLENLMSSRGIDRNKLCSDLGLKYTTVRDWLKGITYPRIGKIELLADYFGVNKSDLAIDWDGQTYIKKVYREPDGLRLVSLNPKYKDRFAPYDEDPRIIGKIVGNFMPIEN